MTRKNLGVRNLLLKCVPRRKRICFYPRYGRRKEGDNSCFGWVNDDTWWGKSVQLNTSHDLRRRKFTSPILRGWCSKGSFRLDATQWTSVLVVQQKTWKNLRSVSALFFITRICYFFLLTDAVVSVSILSFFLPATAYKL